LKKVVSQYPNLDDLSIISGQALAILGESFSKSRMIAFKPVDLLLEFAILKFAYPS